MAEGHGNLYTFISILKRNFQGIVQIVAPDRTTAA
jgi:hypothetical protein